MRFNPPPNWPAPPPGWVPDANWQPDPAWPAPPPGWQLWVDDNAPVPYPPPPETMSYPQQPLTPVQSVAPSRARWWLAAGVIGAVVIVVLGLSLQQVLLSPTSRTPNITTLSSDMLVSRGDFPDPDGGKWISGLDDPEVAHSPGPDISFDPPQCSNLFGDPAAIQQSATAILTQLRPPFFTSIKVQLALTPGQHSVAGYLPECSSFTETLHKDGKTITTDGHLEPLKIPKIPSWAKATTLTSASASAHRPGTAILTTIGGYYRGILVTVGSAEIQIIGHNDDTRDERLEALGQLFNAQIEKLANVPGQG